MSEPEGPFEGVPPWLRSSLLAWVKPHILYHSREVRGGPFLSDRLLRRMDRLIRAPKLGEIAELTNAKRAWDILASVLENDQELFLDVVDFLVGPGETDTYRRESLETILSEGGSVWAVVIEGDHPRLEHRVDPTVREAAMAAMSMNDRPSAHLATAWASLYGRNTSPSHGYQEAVRAVEAAAKPIITPKDSKATLGKMISAMEMAPQKWACALQASEAPIADVTRIMELLWNGQHDRHGTDDENVQAHVNLEEARAALHLAILLVQWFRQGAIWRA